MENLLGPDLEKPFIYENYIFDTITIHNISKDLLYSLSIQKKENIIHGDLKPDNYLWDCFNLNDKNIRSF